MRLRTVLFTGLFVSAATIASAQTTTVPAGAPAPGTEVQIRYTNPSQMGPSGAAPAGGQSTTTITGSGTNPYHAIQQRRAGAAGGEGEEGESSIRDPFSSGAVIGVGQTTARGPVFVAGADIYRGIIPSTHDTLPHIERYRRSAAQPRRANSLTWLGFQPFEEYTRVFIQTGRASSPTVTRSPDGLTLTVRLPNTQLSLHNFTRSLETAWFGTPVHRVTTERVRGGATDVVIELNSDVEYQMQTFSGGAEYIFLDFIDPN